MVIHGSRPSKLMIAAFGSLIMTLFASLTACGAQPNTTLTPAAPTFSSPQASPVVSPAVVKTSVLAQYTLTTSLVPDGAGTVSPDQKAFDPNTNVLLKLASNPGYRFDHWSGDLDGTSISPTILMDKSKNITANFVKQYSVSCGMVPVEGGTVNPAPGSYDAGTQIKFTAKPQPGYVFDSWSGDVTGSLDQITVTVDTNKDVKANFKPAPTLTETPPAIITTDILDAQTKGLVEVSAIGQSLFVIYVSATSKSSNPLYLTIPAGTVFNSPNTGVSSMVVISDVKISLAPHETMSQKQVFAVDIDMEKAMPESTTPLSLSQTPLSGDLKLFVDCAVGPTVHIELKLVLYALWTIENNPARSEFHKIVTNSMSFLPADPDWAQIKDVFQKAGVDTSKYKTFR
jgi:uncharacterized repeat protein (TIGR02543 family)